MSGFDPYAKKRGRNKNSSAKFPKKLKKSNSIYCVALLTKSIYCAILIE